MARPALFLLFVAIACGTRPDGVTREGPAPPPDGVELRLGISHTFPLGADPDSTSLRAMDFEEIVRAGFHVVRTDFAWERIEPSRDHFDFSAYDRLVDEARARNLEVLALLDYGNPWASASGNPFAPPQDPEDFGRFAGATAAHFRGRVKKFEVWNEPNAGLRFWAGAWGGNPPVYARVLEAAYRGIKAVAPEAVVSIGGTFYPQVPLIMPGTLGFTRELYETTPDVGRFFDVFAFHPYRYPFVAPELSGPVPALDGEQPLGEVDRRVRALLDVHGDGHKPLWVTELGWHTASLSLPFVGVSERDQARFLVRSAVGALADGVQLFIWYALRDGPLHTFWQEDAFGIIEWADDPLVAIPRRKPAFFAQAALAEALQGTRFDRDVSRELLLPDGARALRFSSASRAVTVLWTVKGSPGLTAAVPLGLTRSARVVLLDGATEPLGPRAGASTIEVPVTEDPSFVVVQ